MKEEELELPEMTIFSISLRMDQLGTIYLDKEFVSEENIKKYFSEYDASVIIDMGYSFLEAHKKIEEDLT